MADIIAAKDITLHDLEEKFAIRLSEERQFFQEWQSEQIALGAEEKKFLDMARAAYMNMIKYSAMPENAVKLTVLSPLLHLADFFLPPFHIRTEASVSVSGPNEELTIEGRIDILVLQQNLWVLVIESKRAEFSVKVGMAQILSYMLADPAPGKPCYGLVTNGGSFLFLKLMPGNPPVYGISRVFDLLNPGNDLYAVLSVLKTIRNNYLSDAEG
ncbi:restriction endonuclease subunit R [Candidatus Electronema sp. JC]|uniref:restriction endonuclease subunit R n=1 Tax=Candidatus Electronema sp. JC TaxID=3401570 RepID=UPI003B434BDA